MTRSRDVANIDTILTTKGDIYAASAAYTPARLGVGNNGETLVADSSQTAGLRYNPPVGSLANPFINGGMDIWQRGTSIAGIAGVNYTADRHQFFRGAYATGATISRQSTNDTTNLPNIQYCARVQRDSGNTSTQSFNFSSSVETANALPFAGKAVTFSFYARKGANFSDASSGLFVALYSGTGTDQSITGAYTGLTTVASTTATLTTTWQRFVITGTIGSTATEIAYQAGFTPVGTAGANDWFEITGVQLDVGTWTATTAPTFRRSGGTLAGELAACQRYYWRFSGTSGAATLAQGTMYSTTAALVTAIHPVPMRVAPTSVDVLNVQISDTVNTYGSGTSTTINQNSVNNTTLYVQGLTAGTQFRYAEYRTNTAGGYIGLNAEL